MEDVLLTALTPDNVTIMTQAKKEQFDRAKDYVKKTVLAMETLRNVSKKHIKDDIEQYNQECWSLKEILEWSKCQPKRKESLTEGTKLLFLGLLNLESLAKTMTEIHADNVSNMYLH